MHALRPHKQHGLSFVCDLQLVVLEEVLGHTCLLAVSKIEKRVAWTQIKLHIVHDVGSLDSVVGDDALTNKLLSDFILPGWNSFM